MARAGAWLLISLALAAGCSQSILRDKDNPFAPGVARNEEAVDGIVVGNRLLDAGQYELAIDAFNRAAVNEGLSADVLSGLGAANLGLGRLGTAEKLLRDALDKDERSPEIWNNLGVLLLEKGENAEAVQHFKRAFALDNGESDAIRDNLRLVLAKQEDPFYSSDQEQEKQDYKLVRRGGSDYLIRETSE
ncbi:tetratricopeptide repeat protein [Roseovarius phycicola]|uniref:Tetratricopeptide repeat protein n=1 Tax=Roseovarius phycicola TaxID=3080976 RepID=A0ABZ2HDP3_9RHOB